MAPCSKLCNERGESVIAGLKRLHPTIPKAIGGIAIFFGHAGNSYCLRGAGEAIYALVGGNATFWSFFCVVAAMVFLFQGGSAYDKIESKCGGSSFSTSSV